MMRLKLKKQPQKYLASVDANTVVEINTRTNIHY